MGNEKTTGEIPLALQSLRSAKGHHRVSGINTTPKTVVAHKSEEGAVQGDEAETHNEDTSTPGPEEDTPNTAENPQQSSENHDYEKRYFDLKKHHDTVVPALRNEVKELQDAVSAKAEPAAAPQEPQIPETVSEFSSKYPEVYKAMEQKIAFDLDNRLGATRDEIKKEVDEVKQRFAESDRNRAAKAVLDAHPDAAEVRDSSEFQIWLANGPPVWRSSFNSPDPVDAIYLLDEYKKHIKQSKGQQKRKIDASKEVDVKGATAEDSLPKDNKKIWRESELRALVKKNPRIFEDETFVTELDKARREGRYKIDV